MERHQSAESDHSARVSFILAGVLIAAVSFVLLIMAVGRFTPTFLHFAESRWAKLLLPLATLLITIGGLIRSLRKTPHLK
jgi:hypothetical protein